MYIAIIFINVMPLYYVGDIMVFRRKKERNIRKIRSLRGVDIAEYIYYLINKMQNDEGKTPDEIITILKEKLEQMIVKMKDYTFDKVETVLELEK